jgi:acylphosphatase
MQSAGIVQHGFVKNPACCFPELSSVYRGALYLCYNRAAAKKVWARSVAVETQAKRFYVSGRVQGVGFRFFAERTASSLGVGGYVRNLFDGRVEVYAIGSADQMEALRNALQRGPRMAGVDRVDEHDADILREYANVFSIESDE